MVGVRPMSTVSVAVLRDAVDDPDTRARYAAKVRQVSGMSCPLLWVGAIAGRGHGRFWLGQVDGQDVTVIAHRFGYALAYGVDDLLSVEVLSHACDNPLCQTIGAGHLHPTTNARNRSEWAQRRRSPGLPLRDLRGARGRAGAIRDAALAADDVLFVASDGLGGDLYQDPLW